MFISLSNIFVLKLLVICVLSCDTFKNTQITASVKNKTGVHTYRISGCIERIAFGGDLPTEIDIDKQKLPILKKDAIRNMSQLRRLSIKHCNLGKVEAGAFRNTPRLATIEITDTKLSELYKGTFIEDSALEAILLRVNKVDVIEDNVFANMSNLKKLDLGYNRLDHISRNWFYNLKSIQSLDLRNNFIRTVPRKAFIHLRTLKYLSLEDNQITYVQVGAFEGLKDMDYLALRYNLLKTMKPQVFPADISIGALHLDANKFNFLSSKIIEKVGSISLDGNPWSCKCIEDTNVAIFEEGVKIIPSEACKGLTIPACALPKNPVMVCKEEVDDELTELFYAHVESLRYADQYCVRFE